MAHEGQGSTRRPLHSAKAHRRLLLYTDDHGVYFTNLRDTQPTRVREFERETDGAERILAACRQHTVKLSDQRLDLPQKPPYMMEHNLWVANAPGSTLFIPLG